MTWEGIGIMGCALIDHTMALVYVPSTTALSQLSLGFLLVAALVSSGVAYFYWHFRWQPEKRTLLQKYEAKAESCRQLSERIACFGQIIPHIVMEIDCSGKITFINGPWPKFFDLTEMNGSPPETVF